MNTQLQLDFADYYDRYATSYVEKQAQGQLYFNNAIEVPAVLGALDKRIKSYSGAKILDVGSGLGIYSEKLARTGASVTALDISPQMVEITKNACKDFNVTCLNEDFLSHAVTRGSEYDFVVAGFMLGYFENIEIFFQRLWQVTKRGSIVFVSSIHPFKAPYSKTEKEIEFHSYFRRQYHVSNFLNNEEPINLRRWLPEEVTQVAYSTKFAVDRILEPRPVISYSDYGTKELFDYYSDNPSVIIYELRRR